jgi:hypothetical protein
MSCAKTTAQWRREVPAYDRMCRDVEAIAHRLPFGGGRGAVAHIDPNTRTVSFILRVTEVDLPLLRGLVGDVPLTHLEPNPGFTMWVYRGSPDAMDALKRRLGVRR